MSRKRNRKVKRRRIKKNRVARQTVGNQTRVFRQESDKAYDVEMIRDFLEQLLLETRVQHFENLKSLSLMEKYGDIATMCEKAEEDVSPALVQQLQKYLKKYTTQLIFTDEIDPEGATQTEINEVTAAYLQVLTERRDQQIGHLEALQELFDESLMCAKLPLGMTSDGHFCSPTRVLNVRGWIDQYGREDES